MAAYDVLLSGVATIYRGWRFHFPKESTMTPIGKLSSLLLLACATCLSTTAQANAQAKKSDAVVKVKAEAEKPGADGTTTIHVSLNIDSGWHLYANPVGQEDLADTATTVTVSGAKAEAISYPPGRQVKDKTVGDYKVYEGKVTIAAKVRRPAGGGPIDLAIKFQACNESKCLVPATVKLSVP
jgi:DsbC/DsbD-like thiol-disulfide interchange protein